MNMIVNYFFNSDCRPTFMWMYIRHGTSYPNTNESLAIRQLHLFKDRVIKNHEERGSKFNVFNF
jgi:hypothetical protein